MEMPPDAGQTPPLAVVEIRLSQDEVDARRKIETSPEVAISKSGSSGLRTQLQLDGLRDKALRDAALAYSSQKGLHWRYSHINEKVLDAHAAIWDRNFNFRPYVERGVIFLPSVLKVGPLEYLEDGKKFVTNVQFTIDEEAAIVANAPTFRNYLYKSFPEPKPLHPLLTPRTDVEKKIWEEATKEGWDIGVTQADAIFDNGLQEMLMDLEGRMTYRAMQKLNMVSPPDLLISDRGVTFNGRTMNVGEVIYEITDPMNFKNIDAWKAAFQLPSREKK